MTIHTATANTIDWNKVLRVTLRATWWLLKALFKVALFLGSIVMAILVFVLVRDDDFKEEEITESPNARFRYHYDEVYDDPFSPMCTGGDKVNL
jgi:hypothetical protein